MTEHFPSDILSDIPILRRELHEIPETAFCEKRTMERLIRYLHENTDLEVVAFDHWFYAYYHAGADAKTIAFRADFDAVCGKDGKPGHYCGHDGHAAILAGFGRYISETRPAKNVLLLFQPAEETGEGALICRDILTGKKRPGSTASTIFPAIHREACFCCPGHLPAHPQVWRSL